MNSITPEQLTGQDQGHLDTDGLLHQGVIEPWNALVEDARVAGFDLVIASSFRSFERQASIWNAKTNGQRPVLDSQDNPIDISQLGGWELLQAILRWSAIPGASRHHWGTDIDVYDRSAVEAGYSPQLIQAEVCQGGPFEPLHKWLDEQIAKGGSHGFFRPYQNDFGGVAPERWHLSYAPLSKPFQQQLSLEMLKPLWRNLALGAVAEQYAEEIYQSYVAVPWSEYPE